MILSYIVSKVKRIEVMLMYSISFHFLFIVSGVQNSKPKVNKLNITQFLISPSYHIFRQPWLFSLCSFRCLLSICKQAISFNSITNTINSDNSAARMQSNFVLNKGNSWQHTEFMVALVFVSYANAGIELLHCWQMRAPCFTLCCQTVCWKILLYPPARTIRRCMPRITLPVLRETFHEILFLS